MKKLVIALSLLALILFVVFGVFGKRPIAVKKIDFEKTTVKRTVSAGGVVISKNDISLAFPASSVLEAINVKKGDLVKKGQLLAVIYNYDRTKAAQALKDARDIAIRDKELFEEDKEANIDAYGGTDEYNIQLRKLDELISKAEASYQAQLGDVSKTYLYAPIDGTVVNVAKDKGEVVALGEEIVRLADLGSLLFEIALDQEDFGLVKVGQPVEITLDSFEGETFEGTITELPYYADTEASSSFTIKIAIVGQTASKVLLGMTGDAYIVLAQTDSVVNALSFDQILYDKDNKPYVFVLKDGKAEKKDLEMGLEGDLYIEVKNEISDQIVAPLDEKIELTPGAVVKLQE